MAPAGHAASVPVERVSFAALAGWQGDAQDAALAAFRRSCAAGPGAAWRGVCAAAEKVAPGTAAARAFFETHFTPYLITAEGFLTGYYEPELDGALKASGAYRYPLYRKPQAAGDASFTRADIRRGALAGRGLELVHLADPVDVFFVHVQGSARIRLDNGKVMRVGFAGRNEHPYTAIGKVLIERGAMTAGEMTADALKAWLRAHPEEAGAVMDHNRSFIFFRAVEIEDPALGPVGGEGVHLTPRRSLAVDTAFHAYGTPVWIAANLPNADGSALETVTRLMVAQDTGSAIRGVARGDIFFGAGDDAGFQAGLVKHPARFVFLWPNGATLPSWARVK